MHLLGVRRDEPRVEMGREGGREGGGARGRLIKQTRGDQVEPRRKSAGGEPYDLTDLMRYIYDGLSSFPSFPIADVVAAEGDLSSARTRCRGYNGLRFFSQPSYVLLSLFLSRLLPLRHRRRHSEHRRVPRAFLFFLRSAYASSPIRLESQSLSLFPRGEWTFRYSFCAG